MAAMLEIRVRARALPLPKRAVAALNNLDRYDLIVFTSKNAASIFAEQLHRRGIKAPRARMCSVGPRKNLLKLPLAGKRILFPRSALAPGGILKEMRKRAASVRTITLYTVDPVPLSASQRRSLLRGEIEKLYFKSPSGIAGFLKQLRERDRAKALAVPALCIGTTTAAAARKAGWKKISVKSV